MVFCALGFFWEYCGWLVFAVVGLVFGGFVCLFKNHKTDLAREHSVSSAVAGLSFCVLGVTDLLLHHKLLLV